MKALPPLGGTIAAPNVSQTCVRIHTCSNVHCFLWFFHSYHTGSLAFGSLILSLVQMIRIVLEYLDHKLKGKLWHLKTKQMQPCWPYCVLKLDGDDWLTGAHNACSRFLLCCLKCCFWCLEHFIRFINRNAYIMVSSQTTVSLTCLQWFSLCGIDHLFYPPLTNR